MGRGAASHLTVLCDASPGWLAAGPAGRHGVRSFVAWAIERGLVRDVSVAGLVLYLGAAEAGLYPQPNCSGGVLIDSWSQFGAELAAGSTHLARQAGAWNGAA
jgi:hypothetical protein